MLVSKTSEKTNTSMTNFFYMKKGFIDNFNFYKNRFHNSKGRLKNQV